MNNIYHRLILKLRRAMREPMTDIRVYTLSHKWAYYTLTCLTLGHWHTFQIGWEQGLNWGHLED